MPGSCRDDTRLPQESRTGTRPMAHQQSPGCLKLVAEAKTGILEIAAPAVLRKLQDKSGWHLLDVREAEEYAAGRIPGAQHLCKGILERDIEAAVPDSNAE